MLIVAMKSNLVINLRHVSRIYTDKGAVIMKFDDGSISVLPCGYDAESKSSLINYIIQCYKTNKPICNIDSFIKREW